MQKWTKGRRNLWPHGVTAWDVDTIFPMIDPALKEVVWCAVFAACEGKIEDKLRDLAQEYIEDFYYDLVLPPFRIELCGDARYKKIHINPIATPKTWMEYEAHSVGCDSMSFVALYKQGYGEVVTTLPLSRSK